MIRCHSGDWAVGQMEFACPNFEVWVGAENGSGERTTHKLSPLTPIPNVEQYRRRCCQTAPWPTAQVPDDHRRMDQGGPGDRGRRPDPLGPRHRGAVAPDQRAWRAALPALRGRCSPQGSKSSSRFRNGPGRCVRYQGLRVPARCTIVLEGTRQQPGDANSLNLAVVRKIRAGQAHVIEQAGIGRAVGTRRAVMGKSPSQMPADSSST